MTRDLCQGPLEALKFILEAVLLNYSSLMKADNIIERQKIW